MRISAVENNKLGDAIQIVFSVDDPSFYLPVGCRYYPIVEWEADNKAIIAKLYDETIKLPDPPIIEAPDSNKTISMSQQEIATKLIDIAQADAVE